MANERISQINQQAGGAPATSRADYINQRTMEAANNASMAQITTTSGKQYTVDRNQMDWIRSRYKQDMMDTYGWDDADQYARQTGQLSAKMRSTYGNSNVDRQLAEMGLPSEKNIESYLKQYDSWHTGTVDQVFQGVDDSVWSKMSEFYTQDYQYENTADDQMRKASGLMPKAFASKYTDTELDESLMMRNLPPVAELDKYLERYNNFNGIDTLYKNAAAKWTDLRCTTDDNGNYLKNDDTAYTINGEKIKGTEIFAKSFFDELLRENENGERVYAGITDLFKNGTADVTQKENEPYDVMRGREVVASGKTDAMAEDFANYSAFSYADFQSKYGDYFSKYLADVEVLGKDGNKLKYRDGTPVTYASLMANADAAQTAKEEQDFYTVDKDKRKDINDNGGVDAFLDRWNLKNPTASALEMFQQMYEHGVDEKYIKEAYTQLRNETKFGSQERKDLKAQWAEFNASLPKKEVGGIIGRIQKANRASIAAEFDTPEKLATNMAVFLYGRYDGAMTEESVNAAIDYYVDLGVDGNVINGAIQNMKNKYVASMDNMDEVDPKVLDALNRTIEVSNELSQKDLDESYDAYVRAALENSSDQSVIDGSWDRIDSAVRQVIGDDYGQSIDPETLFNIIKATADLPWSNEVAVREALADHGFTVSGDFNDPMYANEWTKDWDGLDRERFRSMMSDAGFRLLEDVERTKPDDSLLEDIKTALSVGGGGASPVSMLAFYAIRGSKWDTSKSIGENVRDFFLPSKEEESYALNLGKSLSAKEYEIALDWMDEMVSDGRLTKFEAYNYLCSRGLQDAIEKYDKADWYESIFKEKMVPEMWENSTKTDQLFWDSCTDDDRKSIADSMWADIPDEEKAKAIEDYDWRFDNNIHRTTAQTWAEQITSIIPTVSEGIATGAVGAADWAATLVSGKDELWGVTKELQSAAASIAAYGDVEDNVNGALAARLTTDAAAEMLKMYTLGAVGTSVAGLAGEASFKFGKFMVDMLKTSPFSTAALGNNFVEAKAEGATNAEAVPYAFVLGTLEGVIESLNIDQIWGRVFGQGKFGKMLLDGGRSFANTRSVLTKAWLASLPIAALGEASEEGLSYAAEGIWKTIAAWNGSEWASQFEWSAEDAAEAMLMGGLTGLLGAGLAKGSITTDSIMIDYYKNNGKLSADIVDVELASKYWDSFTDAQRNLYRNGGANVKSIDDFSNLMVQLDNCFRGLTSAQDTYSKLVANEDAKYEAVRRDVKKAEAKLASFNPLDPEQAKDFAKAYSELVKLKGDPNDANSTSALRDAKAKHDAALEAGAYNRDTTLANINAQIAMIQGQFAEHYAGLYLKNEGSIKAKDYNAIEKNMANAKKNGATVTPESRAQAAANVQNRNVTVDAEQAAGYNNSAREVNTNGSQGTEAGAGNESAQAGGNAGVSGLAVSVSNPGGQESGVLGRENPRWIESVPLTEKARAKGIDPVELRTDNNDASSFYSAIGEAKTANPFGAFVTQHDVNEYGNTQTFLSEDGGVGVAVTSDGDIVSVFKNPEKNQSKKASTSILFTALENGGKTLDNFNSADLSDIYLQHGFVPVARIKFNDDYAPDGWNFERDGRPDILFWVHNGDDANTILDKMGTYEMPDVESLPLFEGENAYDEAKAYRDSLVNENAGWTRQTAQTEQTPVRRLSNEEVARIQQTVKDLKFKNEVRFIDDPNEADGWIDGNGNITINRANISEVEAKELADNPAWWLLKHELAHFTEGTAEYEEYSGIVKRIMQRRFGDNYMTVLNEIKNDYAQRGKTLDDPGAERELVAKFMQSGELLNNAESIETLVREQGNLADRIYNWIRYKIQDLKLRRKPNSALARDLLKAERLYAQAYRKANRKASFNSNSETQYSVGRALDSIAKAIDDDYMSLAEKYDAGVATEEETDRLRNIVAFAASQAGYKREAYHGTRSAPFTVFDRNLSGQNYGGYNAAGGGFDFTDTENWARRWGAKANGDGAVRTVHAYLNTGKPFYSYDGVVDPSLAKYLPYTMTETEKENAMKSGAAFHKALEDNGVDFYDVMMREGYGSYSMYDGADNVAVYNPSQIKSADLVTYDDDGNIIPLSDRFRADRTGDDAWKNSDTRYSTGQSWDELLQKYGAQPQGRTPRASDERVPNRVDDDTRVSRLGRSLYESPHMTDDMRAEARDMMVNQNWLSYTPTTNEESMTEARNYIAARQPLAAQQEFHDMVMQGKLGRKTNAIGLQLLADASARGDVDSFYAIATDLQIAATEAGQSAQIFNVLKELKGVGSAYYMQRVVDRLNAKYDDQIQQGKMQRITVSPVLMEQLSQARTVDQITEAEEAVAKEIAAQVPLTWTDRLSSWRYFSMLGNPTTHIRNMTGNLLMKGLNAAKDAVATGIESVGNVDQSQRAHAVLTGADRSMWGDFAETSYNEQARNLSGGGKLGFETFVKQNMRSFDTRWLDALAKFNFNALESEDIMFIRPAYKNALMQYMKAQGYTLNEKGQAGKVDAKGVFHEMTNAQHTAAVEWASEQAWKQTFRDASSLATMLNKLSKEGPVAKLLVEGVMPFKKTPINIAKRGLEYSPAGIIMGTVQLATKVKQGKMSAATAIDNLSSGITGTALMALGVFLAKAGLIRAGGEDKKKYETYLEDTGDQTYSFKFGNVSINMSSIAPATIPLFMGVALQEMASQNDGDVDLSAITDMVAGTLNPFMEMSFMSSLNSALQNYSSNGIGGALGNTLLTAAENYGSQYLPTLGGKVGQFLDPTRRTTKSDATSPIGGNLDYYVRSLAKKVPGLESTLQADVDVWGRTDTKDSFGDWALDFANKFILPTNVKVSNRDAVDRELIRVVESTGVVDFLPSDGNKYFTVKGERYNMNAKQYKEFSEARGQAAYAAIKAVMASPAYANASDEAKADMLNKAKEAAYKQVNNLWKDKLGAFDK